MEIVVAPPFTALHAVAEAPRNTNVGVAAQDLYWEREGAFTGEVSPAMIKEAGAEYVIVGHSERRRLVRRDRSDREPEGDRGDRRRADADRLHRRDARGARAQRDASPCSIGRSRTDWTAHRRSGRRARRGVRAGLGDRHRPERHGRAGPGGACAHPRRGCGEWFGAEAADRCHVIYGGSVKPDNIRELIAEPDVDGALVGGASLDVAGFAAIVTGSRSAAV